MTNHVTLYEGCSVTPARICLGSALFGSEISQAASFAALDVFAEAGGNFLDSAHCYASWLPGGEGASERTIGAWLRARGQRDQIIVGTKGGVISSGGPSRGHLAPSNLRRQLAESLERLGVDYVDLYWLHRDERERSVAEIIDTLAAFRKEGLIRSYGASNWTAGRIAAANAYAAEHGLPGFVADQPGWALAEYPTRPLPDPTTLHMDEALAAWHVATGFPCVPYSSQATGYFGEANARWARDGFAGKPPHAAAYDSPGNRQRLRTAIRLASQHGCTANQMALAYLLSQPFPVFPIVGTANPARIREALAATAVRLSPTETAALNTVSE